MLLFLHWQPAAGGPGAPLMQPMMGQPMMGQPMMRPPFAGVAGAAPGAAAPGAPVNHPCRVKRVCLIRRMDLQEVCLPLFICSTHKALFISCSSDLSRTCKSEPQEAKGPSGWPGPQGLLITVQVGKSIICCSVATLASFLPSVLLFLIMPEMVECKLPTDFFFPVAAAGCEINDVILIKCSVFKNSHQRPSFDLFLMNHEPLNQCCLLGLFDCASTFI